jgi:uncharacterized protein (TIGR02217 family)
MSDSVFPSLPGLTWGTTKTPEWKTIVQESVSGKELAASLMTYPRWTYTLSYEFLRSGAQAELQTLVGFFNARRGKFDDFLYTDPDDNAVTAQQFGTGDGTSTVFSLVRTYGGFTEPVQNLNSAPSIYVNGVLKTLTTDYTISSLGVVTFVNAPASSAALTWSGTYYWRVRFLQDSSEFTNFMQQLYSAKKISFKTVKL